MDLIFHPGAASDARKISEKYAKISERLETRFWAELEKGLDSIATHPERHHFDPSGMRRCNLKKYPYHILFDQRRDTVRVIVIRHHHRHPSYGLRRQ